MRSVIPQPCSLLEAVRSLVPGAANRTLRQILGAGRVRLNGAVCRVARQAVAAGDLVEVGSWGESAPGRISGVDLVFEDQALIVIHKPAGLLTVATEHEHERTAYAYLRLYVKERDPHGKVFIVHRLDKYVSGLLVFAKSAEIKSALQAQFQRHSIERKYLAIVEGQVAAPKGRIETSLAENRGGRMQSTTEPGAGKRAITHYRVLRRFPKYTALEVRLETGRKNQIRAHLSESGHPIVGDRAYGSQTDPLKRLGLHAYVLGFEHPVERRPLRFETQPPAAFRKYLPAGK